jgi:hypothetical protein
MTLADEIQKMILSALESMEVTSANPTHVNHLIQVNNIDLPDLESFLQGSDQKETKEALDFGAVKKDKVITKDFDITKLQKSDAKELLNKGGISPKNLPSLLQSTGGGGLLSGTGGITRIAALAGPVAAPLAIALMIEPMTKAVIKELQRPGGFLDKRVKIDAQKEAFAELDRQTRQNTRIGDRQVIIQQFDGFRNFDGFASTNTSELIRTNADRVLDIGLFDRAEGLQ